MEPLLGLRLSRSSWVADSRHSCLSSNPCIEKIVYMKVSNMLKIAFLTNRQIFRLISYFIEFAFLCVFEKIAILDLPDLRKTRFKTSFKTSFDKNCSFLVLMHQFEISWCCCCLIARTNDAGDWGMLDYVNSSF